MLVAVAAAVADSTLTTPTCYIGTAGVRISGGNTCKVLHKKLKNLLYFGLKQKLFSWNHHAALLFSANASFCIFGGVGVGQS